MYGIIEPELVITRCLQSVEERPSSLMARPPVPTRATCCFKPINASVPNGIAQTIETGNSARCEPTRYALLAPGPELFGGVATYRTSQGQCRVGALPKLCAIYLI